MFTHLVMRTWNSCFNANDYHSATVSCVSQKREENAESRSVKPVLAWVAVKALGSVGG